MRIRCLERFARSLWDGYRLRVWLVLQIVAGGTFAKRRLALRFWSGQTRVCEVGCAAGNVSYAFWPLAGVQFLGVDVDGAAIAHARRRYHRPGFEFRHVDLRTLNPAQTRFDYIVFAGVLHHVADDIALELLASAGRLLAADGVIAVSEPLPATPRDPWLVQMYGRIDRGRQLRTIGELRALLERTPAVRWTDVEVHPVAPFIGRFPTCARFVVARATRQGSASC
jgi:SAM-dependent methyltransferase